MEDVKIIFSKREFLQKSILDILEIARSGKANFLEIKKLEFYSFQVSREDLQYKTQIKNALSELRNFTRKSKFMIQEI